MKRTGLAGRLARESHVSKAAAADKIDTVVNDILSRLRRGKPAALPGLGTFTPGETPAFEFDPRGGRAGKSGKDR